MAILGLFICEFIICKPILGVPISHIQWGPPVLANDKLKNWIKVGVEQCQ